MKKLLIVLGVAGALAIGACETPSPAADPNNGDSSTINSNTQPADTTTKQPADTTQRQ